MPNELVEMYTKEMFLTVIFLLMQKQSRKVEEWRAKKKIFSLKMVGSSSARACE